jgi:hypothetical protein
MINAMTAPSAQSLNLTEDILPPRQRAHAAKSHLSPISSACGRTRLVSAGGVADRSEKGRPWASSAVREDVLS